MHACTITDLSDEILVRIFSFLSAREICRCSKVCSWWCRLANDFHLIPSHGNVKVVATGYNVLLSSINFCLWDFKIARYILHHRNLDLNALDNLPILNNLSTPVDLTDSAVMRVNLVDNKLATVTQDCIIRVWHLEFRFDGQMSCQCLHTLTTYKPRCSVLDIQLKQEAVNESWSVSISHAAEVMENWNLIGFQSVKFQGMNLTNFDCTINLPGTYINVVLNKVISIIIIT
ncbi:hypothetical protein QZH41_013184 [Actinostola sp. cb2023]|nr:hypothetical protein QZH41_013184 [Actinostola sp. cb2023]